MISRARHGAALLAAAVTVCAGVAATAVLNVAATAALSAVATAALGITQTARAEPAVGDRSSVTEHRAALHALTGRWRSTDDPRSELVLDGDRRIDLYDGRVVAETRVSLGQACDEPGAVAAAEGAHLIERESGLCWYVVRLTVDRLDLSHTARGNLLRYRRVDAGTRAAR